MSVHFSSETNSTLFTDCCHVAITDSESHCPVCKQEILSTPRQRWDEAMVKLYGVKRLRKMRSEYERYPKH